MSNSKEASYIAINCVDGLHPIDHSCTRFALGVFLKSVLFSGKIYFPLYLLGAITSGRIRSPKYMIQNFIPNVLRSSVFIASIGGLWVRLACFMYAIRGEHHKLIMFFSPIIASFIGIILEKKERRSELTIYVAQQAVESLTRMAMSRKYIPYIPNFMMYLYAFSLSCLLYFQKNEPHLIGASSKSLLRVFIPVETQPDLPEKFVTRFLVSLKKFVLSGRENIIQKDPLILERNFSESSSPSSSEDESESTDRIYYEKIRQQPKKVICSHKSNFHIGCVLYTLIGFSRSFLMGIGIRGFFLLLPRLMNPRKIKKDGLVLADKGSLNLGMFLGLMTGLSRGVQCLLRYIRGTEDGLNQLIAGLISGVAFYFNGSTEVCMYVASKASEGFYNMLVHRGLISPLPHGEVALFTVCTSILFYNAMVAPHDLRPSYLRFLGRTSGYYFSHIALWFTKVREKFRGGMYHNLEDYEKAMRLVTKIAEKNPL